MTSKNFMISWSQIIFIAITGLSLALAFILMGKIQANVFASPNTVVFGPACGQALIDGDIQSLEWSSAYSQTFRMFSSTEPFTATLYVMNGASNLYMGLIINDDEFTTQGKYMQDGDTLRIDFDNDNNGSLFTADDDVLSVFAAPPQYQDGHILETSKSTSKDDTEYGGKMNGKGAASRIGDWNHLELIHPLCSGDIKDFCLSPGNIVGFRLEYLDTEGMELNPISHLYPGTTQTDVAEIIIGDCHTILDNYVFIPLMLK